MVCRHCRRRARHRQSHPARRPFGRAHPAWGNRSFGSNPTVPQRLAVACIRRGPPIPIAPRCSSSGSGRGSPGRISWRGRAVRLPIAAVCWARAGSFCPGGPAALCEPDHRWCPAEPSAYAQSLASGGYIKPRHSEPRGDGERLRQPAACRAAGRRVVTRDPAAPSDPLRHDALRGCNSKAPPGPPGASHSPSCLNRQEMSAQRRRGQNAFAKDRANRGHETGRICEDRWAQDRSAHASSRNRVVASHKQMLQCTIGVTILMMAQPRPITVTSQPQGHEP
jgi:hypothetical protein